VSGMFLKNRANFFKRIHVRLTLIVTLAAAVSSTIVYVLLFSIVFIGFTRQDKNEMDARLLSYWAAWQYGGDAAVLKQASNDMRTHGSRPFLFVLKDKNNKLLGALIPGGWEKFNLENPVLEKVTPGSYITLKTEKIPYSLIITGTGFENGSRLLIGVSTENRQFLIKMYQRNYLLAMAVIIAAGVILGLIISKNLLSPITRLNKEIDRIIITGELSRRIESSGTGDQMDELIYKYNRLLERVEELISGMRDTLDAVAHDLRTPLTRIRGHAELALVEKDSNSCENTLAMIVEQTDQASSLLSAIMDIAEAEQDMLNLDKKECDLTALANDIVDMYSFIAEEKNIKINFFSSGPVIIQGDPVRIRQIMGNLVDNAVKYSPENSEIDVECGIDNTVNKKTPSAWFSVTDNGPGVPESEQERIFEKLYRGDRSRGSRGLGLGLSIVRAFARAHGGDVSVKNIEGKGARFTVFFPVKNNYPVKNS